MRAKTTRIASKLRITGQELRRNPRRSVRKDVDKSSDLAMVSRNLINMIANETDAYGSSSDGSYDVSSNHPSDDSNEEDSTDGVNNVDERKSPVQRIQIIINDHNNETGSHMINESIFPRLEPQQNRPQETVDNFGGKGDNFHTENGKTAATQHGGTFDIEQGGTIDFMTMPLESVDPNDNYVVHDENHEEWPHRAEGLANKTPNRSAGRRHKRKQTKPKKRKDRITQDMLRLQSTTKYVIPKLPFQRLVREIIQQFKNDFRMQSQTLLCLQEAAELYLVTLFEYSYLCCLHRTCQKLQPRDMDLAQILRGEKTLAES